MSTRVLLVEDEPILISLYALALNRGGFEVLTAADVATAEERLLTMRPHLIVLDLLIPANTQTQTMSEDFHEPTGFQILRLVKSTPQLSDMRVVVLSNLDADEHIRTAKKLGADEYIVKADLNPRDLSGRVSTVLHLTPTAKRSSSTKQKRGT